MMSIKHTTIKTHKDLERIFTIERFREPKEIALKSIIKGILKYKFRLKVFDLGLHTSLRQVI